MRVKYFYRLVAGIAVFIFVATGWAASSNELDIKTYRVTGVSSSDPSGLNVRDNLIEAQSLGDTNVVGHLRWNAKGIISSGLVVEIGSSVFTQIRKGGLIGWVNEKYLADDTKAELSEIKPEKLKCSGTEPSWSLNFSSKAPGFSGTDLENGDFVEGANLDTMASNSIVELGPENWSVTMKYQSKNTYLRTVISRASPMCTDSMSNVLFPYQIIVLQGDVPRPVYGCCKIDIDRE